ncbi:MAG: helix-turn-helix domain-containing protein [Novosphingobium sp.]
MALTIGDLGKATNTKVETVRYYERIGLLPKPPRSAGNYRTYGTAELGRLSFIRRARDLGFPLDQVRTLLSLSDDRTRDCSGIDRIASEHLREVDRKLADLTALRRELKAVIDSCDGGTVAQCRIIEALAPASGAATGGHKPRSQSEQGN